MSTMNSREAFQNWFEENYPSDSFESESERQDAKRFAYAAWSASMAHLRSKIEEYEPMKGQRFNYGHEEHTAYGKEAMKETILEELF